MKLKDSQNQDMEKGIEQTLPVLRHSLPVTGKCVRNLSGVTDISSILMAVWVTKHMHSSKLIWRVGVLNVVHLGLSKLQLNRRSSRNTYSPHDLMAQEGLRVTARIKCVLSFPYSVKTFLLTSRPFACQHPAFQSLLLGTPDHHENWTGDPSHFQHINYTLLSVKVEWNTGSPCSERKLSVR